MWDREVLESLEAWKDSGTAEGSSWTMTVSMCQVRLDILRMFGLWVEGDCGCSLAGGTSVKGCCERCK